MKSFKRASGLLLASLAFLTGECAFAQPAPPTPPAPPSGALLDAWPFSGTNYLSARHCAPSSLTNVALVPTWAGNGLQVDSTNAAWITYPIVESDGLTNLNCTQGSIELWISLDFNSSDGLGNWGPVIEIGNWNTNLSAATGAWGLFISPDGSSLYFSAQTNGVMTNYLNAPISWNAGDWHFIALTYSASNSALYLEGQFVTNGPGMSIVPGPNVLTNGFSIGSDSATGLLQSRAVYNFLTTYNYQLDPWGIGEDYTNDSQFVFPLPSSGGSHADDDGPPSPGGGGSGTNYGNAGGPSFNIPDYGPSDFWVEPSACVTNASMLTLIVHATTNGVTNEPIYELLCTTDLTPPINWSVVQMFVGATNTNATVLTIPISFDVDVAFFQVVNLGTNASFADSSLPAWYLLENGLNPISSYTGTNLVSNDYLDPMGDGWNYLALFQNRMNPTTFYAPPAPNSFQVVVYTNANYVCSWEPAVNLPASGAGAVTGYTIGLVGESETTNYITVGPNITSYTFNANSDPDFQFWFNDPPVGVPFLTLQANYVHTNSLVTAAIVNNFNPKFAIDAYIVRGPGGHPNLVVQNIPTNVIGIRIYKIGWLESNPNASFDVPVSEITNGIYVIPSSQMPFYSGQQGYWYMPVAIGINGEIGPPAPDLLSFGISDSALSLIPFLDGRQHLQENASFLLSAGDELNQFGYAVGNGEYTTYAFPTAYVYAGYYQFNDSSVGEYTGVNEFEPFVENNYYRDSVYMGVSDLNPDGTLKSDISFDANELIIPYPPEYSFDPVAFSASGSTNSPAPLLTNSLWNPFFSAAEDYWAPIGITTIGNTVVMSNNQVNWFGLPYQNAVYAYSNGSGNLVVGTLSPASPAALYGSEMYFYSGVASPNLQTIGYYFARPFVDTLPSESAFSVTNTSPLMIYSVGQNNYGTAFTLTAWSKQYLANGNTNVLAFVEQYFDKAYLGDTNGNISTNQTGILSEYGDFFPIDPGKTFLVTKPDANGVRGTNVVYTIGLFTDYNHDGAIDTRFSGTDFATPARPFRFWVNDDNDSGDTGGNDIPGQPAATGKVPNGLSGRVNGVRDLVDFFPVYVDIWSLVDAIPEDQIGSYQFILSQADGAINYVATSIDPGEPLSYLTDTNIAFAYSNASVIQITSNGVAISPSGFGSGIILCEASTNTSNPLVLSIYDANTNLLGQTSLYLNITGVEQMFRHKNLIMATYTNRPDGPPDRLADSDVPNEPDTDGNNFLFVHGYNDNPVQARGWQAETFKRMYWSGSHAKFYGVTWFASDGQLGSITPNLQTNMMHAFETAPYLSTFLNTLNGTNIIAAHSLGNMLVLSVLNDCGNTNINTFFMIDAAVAIEALDGDPANVNTNMVNSDWLPYGTNLWASYWYTLFPGTDYRSQLTWKNRLANTQNANVYNFYSSGEEVLRNWTNGPAPNGLSGVVPELLYYRIAKGEPFCSYAWALQELEKGRMSANGVLSSDHNGWKFNTYYDDGSQHMSPIIASIIEPSQLQTNAFFDMSVFTDLFGSSGSQYAQSNTNIITTTGIPAITQCAGANPVPGFLPAQNVNLQTFQNGWPLTRLQARETTNWYHSDLREVAYTYTLGLFTNMVVSGKLK